jgi:LmbE family N-acetylglucosaminyl deacetylase
MPLALAVAVFAAGPANARGGAACSAGSSLYTVAHEDDSILFQDPDLRTDIAKGRCVRTVFLTAGDAGLDSAYWQGRENGAKASYADLAGKPNVWTEGDAGIPGHPTPLFTLAGNPAVSIVFMRIPDGQSRGRGFGSTGMVSLEKLWLETVPSMRVIDGTSSYTRNDLIDALAYLMTSFAPSEIRTQDFVGTFGDGDHSDHHATAFFTKAAGERYPGSHKLISYQDYGTSALAANLSPAAAQAKQQTWFVYAPYDPPVCQTVSTCGPAGYESWWSRQYIAATIDQVGVATPAPPAPATTTTTPAPPAPAPGSRAARVRAALIAACRRAPSSPRCKRLAARGLIPTAP